MQLEHDRPAFNKAGMGLAAVSYDSLMLLQDFARRQKIGFPLLSDHDSLTIRSFGVADQQYVHKNATLDVAHSGEVPVYGLSYPAIFIINKQGIIDWRFVSEHAEIRLTGNAILGRAGQAIAVGPGMPLPLTKIRGDLLPTSTTAGLGSHLSLTMRISVPPGLHVYAPNAGATFHSLEWKLQPTDCWIAPEVRYPEPEWKAFPFAGGKFPVYEGTLYLTRDVAVTPMLSDSDPRVLHHFVGACTGQDGKLRLSGQLNVQACSDTECYPPQSIPLEWKFTFMPPDRTRVPMEHWRIFDAPK